MNIRLNSDSLVPNMRITPSIIMNNVLGMNYKPMESRLLFCKVDMGNIYSSLKIMNCRLEEV